VDLERLKQQMNFLHEVDKVKAILRKTMLFHQDRVENDAEHSWHISLMAVVLQEYSNEPVDLLRVLKMLLIHDLVEIDHGDTMVYDKGAQQNLEEEETARRIFAMLPKEQSAEFLDLWQEFEARKSPDARYATVLDRMEPVLQNLFRQGGTWPKYSITRQQVIGVNQWIALGSQDIWDYLEEQIHQCFDSLDKK
jgi:putative hydrolase of HD superfamily